MFNFGTVKIVTIAGRLGADPELTELSINNQPRVVSRLSLCTDNRIKLEGEYVKHPQWLSVEVWDRDAEMCVRHLTRGASLLVTGHEETRPYTDRNGVERQSTRLISHSICVIKTSSTSENAYEGAVAAGVKNDPVEMEQPSEEFAEVPF